MAKLELELTPKTVKALEEVVEDFNAATGQNLTLEEWAVLTLEERAIGAQLGVDAEGIKRELDAEVPRRIASRRRELMDALRAV